MSDHSLVMEKSTRRVRFSLPEARLIFPTDKRGHLDKSKICNETLINIIPHPKGGDSSSKEGILIQTSLKLNEECKSSSCLRSNSSSNNFCINEPPCETYFKASSAHSCQKQYTKPIRHSMSGLPMIERKSSSLDEDISDKTEKVFSTYLTKHKSSDDLRDLSNFRTKNSITFSNNTEGSASMRKTNSRFLQVPEFAS